ncbi:hypothetical protein [Fretibacter rubidus]|uniref:hypothetical protein n=1 Tax=Fretibacter rubidus TaxID=570162 RepID=UPI003529DF06
MTGLDALKDKIAICVLSYDGSSDLWDPFFDYFDRAWPNCPLPLYLLTNFKDYDRDGRVTTIKVGEDVDWSSNMLRGLPEIPQERILFIFDDFFVRKVNIERLTHAITLADKHDWPYITMHPNNYQTDRVAPGVKKISETGIYRCTLVYGLFKKDTLLSLLKAGESAWDFEIESGKRARGIDLYSVDKKVFKDYHLLRKGFWMRRGYSTLNKEYEFKDRPVETHFNFLVRETKEFLFRLYHRTVPPTIIERKEKRRTDK